MTKRKKPQGKLNEDVIIRGLISGEKLKDIAVKAGSLAQSDDNKSAAIITKVKRSVKIQAELERHRNSLLVSQSEWYKKLKASLFKDEEFSKLSADQKATHFSKAANALQNLTKQDQNTPNTSKTPVQINIMVKSDKELNI